MRKRHVIQILFYLVFGALVILAMVVSGKLSEEQEAAATKISEFSVMLEGREISALYFDGTYMWVGCNDGLLIYDGDTQELIKTIDELEVLYTSGIEQTPDGTVWIGHEEGMTGIGADGERMDFSYPDLPKGRINTVEWDGRQLWCGSYSGAARLVMTDEGWSAVQLYGAADGLISDSVNAIRKNGDELWFASYLDHRSGGLTIMENDRITCIGTEEGLPHPYVTSLQVLPDGAVLAGCGYMESGGLAMVVKEQGSYQVKEVFDDLDGIPGEKVRYLYYDENGYLWITTEYDGILIVDFEKNGLEAPLAGLTYTVDHGLSDNEIKCIAETADAYWLGGKYGLTLINKSYIEEQMREE